jgi:hypothetical protein
MHFLPDFPLHATPLMAFGLMLLVGAIGGYIAHRLSWLPSITGFIVVGFACGPGGLVAYVLTLFGSPGVLSTLVGAIVISSSPAVSLAFRIARETADLRAGDEKADGKFAEPGLTENAPT